MHWRFRLSDELVVTSFWNRGAPSAPAAPPHSRWRAIPRRFFFRAIVFCVLAYASAWTVRLYARKYYIFAWSYLQWSLTPAAAVRGRPTDIFFLFVDHFEPDYDVEAVRQWTARYRLLAARHRDSDGRPLQHTWFYPGEQSDDGILEALEEMAAGGLGEVELHFHHGLDSEASLRTKLSSAIADFQRHGFLTTAEGRTAFAFIHGHSGLDNSNGAELCGVNTELRLLRELGCFADFTFPSVWEDAQPPTVNGIYAARDDDGAKSYARLQPLASLRRHTADLMIFEGPLIFAPTRSIRHLFVELDDGDIHAVAPASASRVDRWVRANVHVAERPDWVFVKVFAHGVSSSGDVEASLGPSIDRALDYLESRFNDGRVFRLHYITAREAFNLALAASDGVTGDPQRYFDYVVPPYLADGQRRLGAPKLTGEAVESLTHAARAH